MSKEESKLRDPVRVKTSAPLHSNATKPALPVAIPVATRLQLQFQFNFFVSPRQGNPAAKLFIP
jgi:hypothetical protein